MTSQTATITMTAESHQAYNRKCRCCGATIVRGTVHWVFNGGEDGFECWECPVSPATTERN